MGMKRKELEKLLYKLTQQDMVFPDDTYNRASDKYIEAQRSTFYKDWNEYIERVYEDDTGILKRGIRIG